MMKFRNQMIFGGFFILALALTQVVAHTKQWDNFKLQYFFLTKYLNNQEEVLSDIRAQNVNLSSNTRVELSEILDGGPPKDGIPSIDHPRFDTDQTTPFDKNEWVIGVIINGEAKAYPIGIMNWHEIVNDTLGTVNITISYCPLCDTIVAFKRQETTYGVSGKLYQSCLVMYDRSDETLYSQPWAIGVVGAKVNQALERIPVVKTTLKNWLSQYPDSQILSTETGHQRDYFEYPYGSYYTNTAIIFPVGSQERRILHPKAMVSYIWEPNDQTPYNQFAGESQQFSHQKLQQQGTKVISFNGRQIRAKWSSELETVVVEEMDGTPIPSSTAFAFVYPAFFAD